MTSSNPDTTGSLRAARQIDDLCDRFEATWKTGKRARIEDLLQQCAGAARLRLLEELLLLEISLRKRAGETPLAADYAGRFAELSPPGLGEILRRGLGEFASRGSTPGNDSTVAQDGGSRRIPQPRLRYFGDYELLDQIARGGMGVVYKARQISLNRLVAVKMILSGQFASEAQVKRFYSEAESAAQLDHPNIVSIYEVGEHDGDHYFSMALVEGTSLAAKLTEGPMEPRRAAELLSQVAQAIEYAHSKGVIHRDLKPSNVLLDANGRPRVTDFGLAKRVSDADGLTMTGDVLGTPSYMPPEQAAGKIDAVGPASDVYALGAVLYALLSGRPPFQAASSHATLTQVVDQEPVRLRQLNSAVPRDLETIAQKCLEKAVARRYSSAQQLGDELQRFLEGRPILARPIHPFERAARWCVRNPLTAALVAGIVVSLSLGSTIAVIFGWQASLSAITAEKATEKAKEKTALAETNGALYRLSDLKNAQLAIEKGNALGFMELERDKAEERLLLADLRLITDGMQRGEYGRAEQLLFAAVPNTDRDDRRNWEWYYLLGECRKSFKRLQGHLEECWSIAVSPDGERMVSLGIHGEVRHWNLPRQITTHVHRAETGGRCVVWRPKSRQYAIGLLSGKVLLHDEDQDVPVDAWQIVDCPINCLAWDPDGRRLACGSQDGWTCIWDAESKVILGKTKSETSIEGLGWSSDGALLARSSDNQCQLWNPTTDRFLFSQHIDGNSLLRSGFSHDDGFVAWSGNFPLFQVHVLDRSNNSMSALLGHTGTIEALAWHPTKRILATGGFDQTIRIWDLETKKPAIVLDAHTRVVRSLAWTSSGTTLIATSDDRSLSVWSFDSSTVPEKPSIQLSDQVRIAKWSPTAARFATAAGNLVQVWDATQRLILSRDFGYHTTFDWSPDGTHLAVGSASGRDEGGSLSIWNIETDEITNAIPGQPNFTDCVAWSPNGKTILTGGVGGQIVINDAVLSKAIGTLQSSSRGRVVALSWSPNSRQFVTGIQGGESQIWDLEARIAIRKIAEYGASDVSWSRSGKFIALAAIDGVIAESATGRVIQRLQGHHGYPNAITWSPDESRVATGGWDTTIRLWDPQEGSELLVLRNHSAWITSLQFNRAGTCLLSASQDKTVRMWDALDGYAAARDTAIPWWIVGTFPADFDAHFSPELAATTDKPVVSAAGTPLPWRKTYTRNNFRLNFSESFENPVEASVYALTFVFSPIEQAADMRFGVDDAAIIWLNNEQVFGANTQQSAIFDSESVPVMLQAGWNRVLVRAINRQLDFQLYLRFCARDPAAELVDLQWSHRPDSTRMAKGSDELTLRKLAQVRRWASDGDLERAALGYVDYLRDIPNDAAARLEFGRILTRLGRLDEAATEYERYVVVRPRDEIAMLECAMLLAYQNRAADYRRFCENLVLQRKSKDSFHTRERRAKACLFLPNALEDYRPVREDADQALALNPEFTWSQMAVALTAYRQQEYVQCNAVATKALANQGDFDGRLALEYVQAMCLHQQQKTEAAERLLRQAIARSPAVWQKPDFRTAPDIWHDTVLIFLLQRESLALIGAEIKVDSVTRTPLETRD